MLKSRPGKVGSKQVQVVVVGALASGKSAFVSRVLNEEFPAEHVATLGAELFVKEVQYQEEFVVLNLWSCGGHERFRPLVQHIYDNAVAAIIIYDRTKKASFGEVAYWRNEMMRCFPSSVAIIVAMKSDLNEDVAISANDADEQASRWNLPHWTASAKTGENVEAIINLLLTSLAQRNL